MTAMQIEAAHNTMKHYMLPVVHCLLEIIDPSTNLIKSVRRKAEYNDA